MSAAVSPAALARFTAILVQDRAAGPARNSAVARPAPLRPLRGNRYRYPCCVERQSGQKDELTGNDRKEAFAAGAFAAQSVLTGSGSVVLHYDGDRIEPPIVPLERVAGKTRHMPDDFFAGSNTVSDEGRRYFRRLLPKRPDIFPPFV
jgi:hypothetical protein